MAEKSKGRTAPSPADSVGKCTSKQWAAEGTDAVQDAYGSKQDRPMLESDGVGGDDKSAGQETCTADTLDGASGYQAVRCRGDCCDDAAQFKDGQSNQERRLGVERHVDSTVQGLESRRSQQVCTAVPSYVVVGMETGCDVGDCLSRMFSCWVK